MKRKSFLKGSLGVAAAGLLGGGTAAAQEAAVDGGEKRLAAKNHFLLGWLKAWLANLKGLPEAEKVTFMEANGLACAERGGTLAWAKSFNGDLDKFLEAMRKEIGENNARREGNQVSLVYDKCFCPLVGDLKEPLPPDYCLCTRGWTRAVYGAVTGKPVTVELKATVKRGDPKCLIEVSWS
jgi:predicted hydrocarbon binding protein